MIKVNLYVGKKPFRMPVVAGVDTANLPIKGLILVYIISLLPDMFIKEEWQNEIQQIELQVGKERQLQRSLSRKARNLEKIQDEIDRLAQKEQMLSDKLNVVKELMKIKKNPMKILLYISKNIPTDLWIESLEIRNDKLVIKGNSKSYKSIGIFMENLKNSTFFQSSVRLSRSQTITDPATKKRLEVFEIQANISRYT
jgi:Tfp pilus assembly protein PilN